MAMRCFVCGKKLNIFSDYKQIKVKGKKKRSVHRAIGREKKKR